MYAIKQPLVPEFASVELQFHYKYYCLAEVNALLKYAEFTENFMITSKSFRVEEVVGFRILGPRLVLNHIESIIELI